MAQTDPPVDLPQVRMALQRLVGAARASTGARLGAAWIGPALEPLGGVVPGVGTADEAAASSAPLLERLAGESHPVRVARVAELLEDGAGGPPGLAEDALLGVPLRVGQESVGSFCLAGKAGGFTADDERVAEALAVSMTLLVRLLREALESRPLVRFFDAVVRDWPDPVAFSDREGRYTYMNPAAERSLLQLFGRRLERFPIFDFDIRDAEGRPIDASDPPELRVLRGETVQGVEVSGNDLQGRHFNHLLAAVPVRSESGDITGVAVSVRDVTSMRELERLRNEFAAILVHDLRSPLTALVLTAEGLLRHATGHRAIVPVHALERLRRIGVRLGELVGELLDASRIELGRMSFAPQTLDVTDTVRDLSAQLRPALRGHPVVLDTDPATPPVRADPLRFAQVFTNLLDNASKYSREGAPITVTVRPRHGGSSVAVTDEGEGIAAADVPRLFDRFFQAERARYGRKGGLGLGLYITKGLVEAQGGRIRAQSSPGRGSRFEVWFPAPGAPDASHLASSTA